MIWRKRAARCRALATLDAIVFAAAGVFILGFDHESPMSPAANDEELWPGASDTAPGAFAAQVAAPVAEILAGRPLTAELVGRLNPEASLAGLADDLPEIGHPA